MKHLEILARKLARQRFLENDRPPPNEPDEAVEVSESGYILINKFLKTIFFCGPINNAGLAEFLRGISIIDSYEEQNKSIKAFPKTLFISSRGGDLGASFAIYDQVVFHKFNTCAMGEVFSGAATIFLGGKARFMMPNSFLVFHDTRYSVHTDDYGLEESDVDNQQLKEFMRRHIRIITSASRNKINNEEAQRLILGRKIIWPELAIKYGLAHNILKKR